MPITGYDEYLAWDMLGEKELKVYQGGFGEEFAMWTNRLMEQSGNPFYSQLSGRMDMFTPIWGGVGAGAVTGQVAYIHAIAFRYSVGTTSYSTSVRTAVAVDKWVSEYPGTGSSPLQRLLHSDVAIATGKCAKTTDYSLSVGVRGLWEGRNGLPSTYQPYLQSMPRFAVLFDKVDDICVNGPCNTSGSFFKVFDEPIRCSVWEEGGKAKIVNGIDLFLMTDITSNTGDSDPLERVNRGQVNWTIYFTDQ